MAADREQAPALLAELLAQPPAVRERIAVSFERFHSPALAGQLVERSLEHKAAGGELAELALALLGAFAGSGRASVIAQAKARAWGALANAYRLQADFDRAERSLQRAAYYVAAATDSLEEAWFFRLRARLRRGEGRLGRAVVLQVKAVERLATLARPYLVAEALIELAALHLATADRPRTVAVLLAAVDTLGGDEEDGELAGCTMDCLAGSEG